MKRLSIILIALLFAAATAQGQQPFSLTASVNSLDITGATGSFTVSVIPNGGYSAAVFLSAEMPSLPGAQVSGFGRIDAPYTGVSKVVITVYGPRQGGTHKCIVTGQNGPATATVSVDVTIPNRTAWQVYSATSIGMLDYWANTSYQDQEGHVALDRANGVLWMARRDSLASFDKGAWKTYPYPPGIERAEAGRFMAISPNQDLWLTYGGIIFRYNGGTWTDFNHLDPSTGLTEELLLDMQRQLVRDSYMCTSNTNEFWMAFTSRFPDLLHYANGKWERIRIPMHYTDSYRRFVTDKSGNLWVSGDLRGTARLLMKYDGTYWTAYTGKTLDPGSDGDELSILSADARGRVWIRPRHAQVISIDGDTITGYYVGNGAGPYLPNRVTNSMFGDIPRIVVTDPNGVIWETATNYDGRDGLGLTRYDGNTWYNYTIENSGLPHNRITYMDVDDAGTLWIVTEDGSLSLVDANLPPNQLFTISLPSSVDNGAVPGELASVAAALYPNPTHGNTTLQLTVREAGAGRISIVNMLGEEVAVVRDGMLNAGTELLPVDVSALNAGRYYVRIRTAHGTVVEALQVQ